MGKLNEKRIELPNPYPVRKDEIIDLVERSTRLVHTATDDKTIQLYIYSNGSERPEAFAEVEITSVGYILHGAEGYDYQGSSMKEFEDDLRDVVFNFDATTSRRFGENAISKETLFENLLNEDYRNWFNFTIKTEKGRYLKATYPTVTELKRCVTPIFGKFEIINQKKLPLTVTQEILDECPETAYVKAGNSTWAENFYSRVVSKGYAYPIIRKNWDAYLVKDKGGFDSCQKDLVINGIDYFPTDTKVGEKIRWRMDINNAEVSENSLFDSILNESSLKEYFFYAPPRPEEDEEDAIIGYIAAVRDYQTQKTKYVDDNGNVCNSKSQAKVFDTKGKADNYSYDHCPEGWTHFVVALKKSDILNEAETTKYMACCYDPEDYYEETNYIDEDGELSCNSSGAKLFSTEDEAIEYADENKPIGWMSFAMPFNTTLNEADDTYKAKVGGKWLKGNKLVKDKKDADTFESKTEPTQRINQMKKDGKLNKNTKSNIVKESINNKNQLFESLLQEVK